MGPYYDSMVAIAWRLDEAPRAPAPLCPLDPVGRRLFRARALLAGWRRRAPEVVRASEPAELLTAP